jgi:ribosomal protein S27AE
MPWMSVNEWMERVEGAQEREAFDAIVRELVGHQPDRPRILQREAEYRPPAKSSHRPRSCDPDGKPHPCEHCGRDDFLTEHGKRVHEGRLHKAELATAAA